MHTVTKTLMFVTLGVLSVIVSMGMVSRRIDLPLRDGGLISIKPASFWRMLLSSTCRITYRSGDRSGTIALTDNWLNGPFIVLPSDNDKVLLCLYDLADMGLWLVKIDTAESYKMLSVSNHLNEIIQASPWKIEEGNERDWKIVYDALKSMPRGDFDRISIPGYDFGILRVYRKQEIIVPQVKAHIFPNLPA